MVILKSRRIPPDKFLEEFYRTITPGVIPRKQFIDWEAIRAKCKHFEAGIDFYESLQGNSLAQLKTELRDSLLSADDPNVLLKAGFELLGHTGDQYVSDVDNLDILQAAQAISKGDEAAAAACAGVLLDLGLSRILEANDVGSTFLGVQVGLESNRRKNVGGEVFRQWVAELVQSACSQLGANFEVSPECFIQYKNSKNGKRVDFGILKKGTPVIGMEVNFYTVQGSKPTEIKRAYANVNRDLSQVGVVLIWITDGAGYYKMKRSLREALTTHPNTYNYELARQYLKDDILEVLGIS